MTTGEFVKLLQEADPDGTAHIRMEGGIPRFIELKEGYWDGPYSYINENGEYVYSTKGLKVDFHCTDIYSFVEDNYEHGKTVWEDIEKLFKFELGYSIESQRKERENVILKRARTAFDDMFEAMESSHQRQLVEAKDKATKGHRWFQNKDIHYSWVFLSPDGKEDTFSNVWKTKPVIKSGLWERTDNNFKEGYYEWIFKNNC